RPVTASSQTSGWAASNVTDGDKSDRSAWHSDASSAKSPDASSAKGSEPAPAKWLEIDLGATKTLGSAVVYTGSAHGVYTSPDRVKDFSLQYFSDGAWKDIPGFTLKGNKYAQVFAVFKEAVTTSRVRFYSTDPGVIKVREIKVFAKGDGPAPGQENYDISGIQRTGEVVHLFAKGFKDEHPLYATHVSVEDPNLDAMTSYDKDNGNYYIWLVQRGEYRDKIDLDLGGLKLGGLDPDGLDPGGLTVQAGVPVTAECVGPSTYGEVTSVQMVGKDKKLHITLTPQTVMLLTIPSGSLKKASLPAAADATVTDGKFARSNDGRSKELKVALDASKPGNNKVSFIRFDLPRAATPHGSRRAISHDPRAPISHASRILLKIYGSNITDTAIFRFHVYGIPTAQWSQEKITWQTAPQLDAKEALIKGVGQKAFVAGELAMDHTQRVHYLDVTDLVKRHGGQSISFAFVRETRQLGDDADKGRTVVIDASESSHPPELEYWYRANATSYYINSRWGNDANTGTTKEDAWQSCRPLEQRSFQPGDSILFAKGSSYTGGFSFRSSGTADRPIVFSSYNAGAALVMATPREKLGDVFVKYGAGPLPAFTNPDWNTLNGNIFHIEGNYIVIDGLYFHDNTNPPGSDHRNKNVQKMGVIYLAPGAEHNIVRHCEFFHSPVAIKIKGSYNLVTKNYLHDATDTLAHSWGPIAIMVVSPHNEISYNRIVNYGSYGGPYGSDGGAVEFDGVDDDFDGRDLNIHHNISINNHGFLELAGRDIDNVTVSYNVSDDTNQFIGGGSMKNVLVYNNTVVRLREPNVDRYVFWTFRPDSCSMYIHNNIFVLPADIRVYGPVVKAQGHVRSFIGNQPHDHNLYFSAGNPEPLGVKAGRGDIIADPMFMDYAAGDLRLRPNSPARLKNMGVCD
ncbi:MAG TPA: discoidin domain-containing protein, partial [Puia sp.]